MLDKSQREISISYFSVLIIFYSFTFGFALHNIIKYIIMQERYKSDGGLLVSFYVFACVILIIRPIEFGL